MCKTSVYTLVNGNVKEIAHRKQQKSQKVMLFSSNWHRVSVMRAISPFVIFAVFDVQVL